MSTSITHDGLAVALAAYPTAGDPELLALERRVTHPAGAIMSRWVLTGSREALRAALADPATLAPALLARLGDDTQAVQARAAGLIGEGAPGRHLP